MGKRSITRQIGRLALRASFVPETLDVQKRTVQLVWTTGARVLRGGLYSEPYYEELSLDPQHVRMARLASGNAPLLNSHRGYDISDVIGVVENAQLERDRGTATVRFDKGAEGEEAMRKVADGILRNTSVGYGTYRMLRVGDADDGIPVFRAVDWEPAEVSMVPIGADAGAGVRSDAATTPCEFIEEEEQTMRDETKTTGTKPSPDPAPAADAGAAEERARILGIQQIGHALKRPQAEIRSAIDAGTGLDAYRAAAVDAHAEAETIHFDRRDPRIQGGEDLTRTGAREGVRNALLHRCAPNLFQLEEVGRSYRGFSMMEMARSFLEAQGVRTSGLSKYDIAGLALGLGTRAGQHTTSDFPLILADVAGKTLRRAYDEAPQTFQAWAKRVTLPDFKPVKRTQLGEAPALTKVLEGGEFTRGTIGEGREVYQLATYGKVFAITRQTLINDDMSAFSRVPELFGRSARDLESDLVYQHFLSNPVMGDGKALFDASHGNTGAGVISIASIGSGRAAMRKQRGLDKKQRINVQVKYLLVPAALETNAEQFVSTQLVANAANQVNVFAGRLQVIAEPRLDDVSAVAWYLTADPAAIDTLEYGYLDGEDGPFLESRMGFEVDGLELKARHDFAAKVIDWRGFYQSSGA
ncbi:MAG TPA: prohead protease/major capsid protein fusion protein [Kofleriaceae bacterium]|nr:prohead protease/major capsid protein fusion protein [Kofleriaceae bacterium]